MPLFGTLDTMQLADLVQWIHGSKLDGILTISADMEETYLGFERGDIVAVGSGDPLRLDLGQLLLSHNVITERQLKDALEEAKDAQSMPDVLLRQGVASHEKMERIRQEHLFEMVLDLFFRDEGSFHFSTMRPAENLLSPHEMSRMDTLASPISTKNVIIEAMKRLDDWQRFRGIFPAGNMVVRAMAGESRDSVYLELREHGSPISIGDLCLRIGHGRFRVYQSLFDLHALGLVEIDELWEGKDVSETIGPVSMLVDSARLLIDEKQFDEAREVLSTATNLDPDNPDARKLLRSLRASQIEYLYGQIPPHKVPVLIVPRDELHRYDLSQRETYLASRLVGKWDVATLVVATPLGELETLRILRKFLHAQIVKLEISSRV